MSEIQFWGTPRGAVLTKVFPLRLHCNSIKVWEIEFEDRLQQQKRFSAPK